MHQIVVTIKYLTTLWEITQKKEEVLEFSQPITLGELLHQLSQEYGPQFRNYIFQNTRVRPELQFLVNGRSVGRLKGTKTMLQDGDQVAVIPVFFPVGGG